MIKMDMKINEHLVQGIKVVTLKGRIDADNSVSIENKLNGLIAGKVIKFIVDMKEVDYLGSSGIRIFISISRKLQELSGSFAIISLTPSCQKIIQSLGIE